MTQKYCFYNKKNDKNIFMSFERGDYELFNQDAHKIAEELHMGLLSAYDNGWIWIFMQNPYNDDIIDIDDAISTLGKEYGARIGGYANIPQELDAIKGRTIEYD